MYVNINNNQSVRITNVGNDKLSASIVSDCARGVNGSAEDEFCDDVPIPFRMPQSVKNCKIIPRNDDMFYN